MKSFIKYFKVDIYRSFINIKFLVAVIVVSVLPFIASAEQQGYNFANIFSKNSIFEFFDETVFWSEIGIINFIIIAFVYADCLCDDLSVKNYVYSITRGNINEYIVSKIVTVFVNSIIVYVVGMLLFAVVSSVLFGFQWEVSGGSSTNYYLYSGMDEKAFYEMINKKQYLLFYLCCIALQSLLYGIASLCSMLMSLFIRNKLLILCIPTLMISVGNYILFYIIPQYHGYKEFFSPDFFYMKDTLQALFIILGVTAGFIVFFSAIIHVRLRRIVIG